MPHNIAMLATFTIALTTGCTVPVIERPSSFSATDQAFDKAESLVNTWLTEIADGEPQRESSLALFAWIVKYRAARASGDDRKTAHANTRNDRERFTDAVEAEGHGAAVAHQAVGYAAVMMDAAWGEETKE